MNLLWTSNIDNVYFSSLVPENFIQLGGMKNLLYSATVMNLTVWKTEMGPCRVIEHGLGVPNLHWLKYYKIGIRITNFQNLVGIFRPYETSESWRTKVSQLVMNSNCVPYLVRFQKMQIWDLYTMLYHPAKMLLLLPHFC